MSSSMENYGILDYGKDFKIRTKDLIMMNVSEKLEFMEKRRKFLKNK